MFDNPSPATFNVVQGLGRQSGFFGELFLGIPKIFSIACKKGLFTKK
jgi:hypothetical protein